MASTTLVESDIEAGGLLVQALDEAGFDASAALWAYHEESEEYRFVLAAPIIDAKGKRAAYLRIAEILRESGLADRVPLIRIEAIYRDDPLVKSIRRLIRTPAHKIVGARVSANYINGELVPDAYVYRAA